MNFDFDEEQRLLQKTARDFLEERAPLARVREIFESDALLDADLWSGVAEMGWTGAAIPESHGGAGFGYLELALLAEETGRALAPIPFGSSVYLVTEALRLAGSDEQQRRWLPELAAGRRIGAFAAAEGPGGHVAAEPGVEWRDGALHGAKEPVLDGAAAPPEDQRVAGRKCRPVEAQPFAASRSSKTSRAIRIASTATGNPP